MPSPDSAARVWPAPDGPLPAATRAERWMLVAPTGPEPDRGARAPEAEFSVVIAAHNAEASLAGAIESALAQSLPPREVIVCDDGSTDGTLAVASSYGSPVRVLARPHAGAAAARNACWRAARTEFVVVLDADDILLPHCLEAYAAVSRARPDLDILTSDAYLELDGKVFDRYYRAKARFVVEDQRIGVLHQHFIFGLAAMRCRALEVVGGYDERFAHGEDTDLFLRMVLAGSRAGLVVEPLSHYRFKPDSLSADRARSMETMVKILERAAQHPTLTPAERNYLDRDLAVKRRLTSLALAERDLRRAAPSFRRRAFAIAQNEPPVFGRRIRLKAGLAGLFPPVARRLLGLRDGGEYLRRATRRS